MAAAAAYPPPPPLQSSFAAQSSASGTPMPEAQGHLRPPLSSATALSQSPGPQSQHSSHNGPGGMGIGMPHEKHRLYALTREAEVATAQSAGVSSREGSVLSIGSDGTGL